MVKPSTQSSVASQALVDYLSHLIRASLGQELVTTALFLAERLHAILPADEQAAYFLALSLLRSNNPQGSIYILRNLVQSRDDAKSNQAGRQNSDVLMKRQNTVVTSPTNWRSASAANMKPANAASLRCAHLYAKACAAVGRTKEGEHILNNAIQKFGKQAMKEDDLLVPSSVNTSGVGLSIQLATLSLRGNRHDDATAHYLKALEECWYCWEAYEGLCYIGKPPEAQSVFASVPGPSKSKSTSAAPFNMMETPFGSTSDQSVDASSSFESSILMPHIPSAQSRLSTLRESQSLFTPPPSSNPVPMFANPALPARKIGVGNPNKEAVRRSTRLTGSNINNLSTQTAATNPGAFLNGLHNNDKLLNSANTGANKGKEPRSRVLSNPRDRKRAKASSPPPASTGGTAMPVFKAHSPMMPQASTNQADSNMPTDPQEWLRSVLIKFGKAEAHLARFEGAHAIETLMTLEVEQRRSWRASIAVGRARMETLDYNAAEKAFAAARESAPFLVSHSDLHSTLLWHLSRSTDLSYLAQQIMSLQPLSQEAWVCSGNVFSLVDDHANALKCFKRAIQIVEGEGLSYGNGTVDALSLGALRPGSAASTEYPYIMAGHECIALEEWEAALGFYREAIRRRKRSYTPWFGLGNVYVKLGKWRLAEYHYQKAAEINTSNAMLLSCVGQMHEKLGKENEALNCYERACLLAPSSAAVRFRKAKLLVTMRRHAAALKDLLSLAALAPDEFNVQFLLGKVYGALGQRQQMTKHFTFAQDLNPKQSQRIRDAIEAIEDSSRKAASKQAKEDDAMDSS